MNELLKSRIRTICPTEKRFQVTISIFHEIENFPVNWALLAGPTGAHIREVLL
jgi:hypothetical protein